YLAMTTLMVGETETNSNITADQIATISRLADNYANTIDRQPVLQATAQALQLPQAWWVLQSQTSVTRDGTQFIDIRVVDQNPQRAQAIADEIAQQTIDQSPSAANERQLAQRQQFIQQQLDALQQNIQQAQQDVAQKQAQL